MLFVPTRNGAMLMVGKKTSPYAEKQTAHFFGDGRFFYE